MSLMPRETYRVIQHLRQKLLQNKLYKKMEFHKVFPTTWPNLIDQIEYVKFVEQLTYYFDKFPKFSR
jgi:hypothetical protein